MSFLPIAGYVPDSDVSEHAKIDLDQKEMEELFDKFDFEGAYQIYAEGKYSTKSSGMRTIQGFSIDKVNGKPKLEGEPLFDLYSEFWGSPTYADDFISAAVNATGDFQGKTQILRSECANKGAQYQAIWMYVIHELEDAVGDCKNSDLNDNDRGVVAWDEGWAFHAGSLEGEHGGSGFLGYALAQKRCANFGTCTPDSDGDPYSGHAAANSYLLGNFSAGQRLLANGDCVAVENILRTNIIPQLTVPLIQGALRYAYLADPKAGGHGNDLNTLSKKVGEGWAFTAAVLPQINACDPQAAQRIRENMDIAAENPVKNGFEAVAKDFQSVYSCLGITCEDIGGLKTNPSQDFVIPPCVDESNVLSSNNSGSSSSDPLSGGAIAGIVIGVLILTTIIAYCVRHFTSKSYDAKIERMEKMYQDHQSEANESNDNGMNVNGVDSSISKV